MTMTTPGSQPTIAIVMGKHLMGTVLTDASISRLQGFAEVRLPDAAAGSLAEQAPSLLRGAQGCIMCWGSPRLGPELLDAAPDLSILAYAAGSVKPVVTPELYDRGVVVTSAASAIADEVASCALGLIICGLKGIFRASRNTRAGGWGSEYRGSDTAGRTVGLIGAGHVGRRVIKLLHSLPGAVRVLLCDPFVSAAQAEEMDVSKVGLEELLRNSDVVSVHAPSLPATRYLLNAGNLTLLKDDAAIVNTARGALIDPDALAAELTRRPTLQAMIDVTDPDEPPPPDHPYRSLPNVILTPHLAGTVATGQANMGALAVEELYRHLVLRQPPLYPVTREMLDRAA